MTNTVVTRFAPSPTGHLHIGGVRTALFNYLFARQNSGRFVLRIEDTDTERNKKDYEHSILASLSWLGLIDNDTPTVRQSERADAHTSALITLIQNGHAYEAEASKKGSGKVVRFKNPNAVITFTDLVRGEVTFNTTELGDFVIARNTNKPLYHLAVVVDDTDMEVTHVIRAEEHISNTPRQILLLEALGYTRPTYAHIPLILAPDKSKLSKRHGASSVIEFQKEGYLPSAIVNYLALLGWHPKDNREIFSMEELIREFDLSRVQRGGAVFDIEKLKSINRHYLEHVPDEVFLTGVKQHIPDKYHTPILQKLLPTLRERLFVYSDIAVEEIGFFFERPEYDAAQLVSGKSTSHDTHIHLEHVYKTLESIEDVRFKEMSVKEAVWDYATKSGRGAVLWPMRYALSGREKSPNPFLIAEILGKDETLTRLHSAIQKLS